MIQYIIAIWMIFLSYIFFLFDFPDINSLEMSDSENTPASDAKITPESETPPEEVLFFFIFIKLIQ